MDLSNGNKAVINKKRTLLLLIAAAVLLVGALVWRIALEHGSLSSRITRELFEHGYSGAEPELYQHLHTNGTSVRAVFGEATDLSAPVGASKQAGFPADIDRVGEVYCLLADTDDGILTVYVVDEKIELAFIEIPSTGEVLPVTGRADGAD